MLQTIHPSCEPVSLAEARNWVRIDADITADDFALRALIASARRFAEHLCSRSFIAQGWRRFDDCWQPCFDLDKGNVLEVTSLKYQDMAEAWQTLATTEYVVDTSKAVARIAPRFGKVWPTSLPQIASIQINYTAGYASKITADAGADTITPVLWPTLAVGDPLVLSMSGDSTTAMIGGLTANQTYYVHSVPVAGSYKLAATVGGSAIDITDTGNANALYFIGVVPEGIRDWIRVRLATIYTHREEVAALERGKIDPLPWVDNMLDPYKVLKA